MLTEKDLVFVSFVAEDYSRSAVIKGNLNNSEFNLVPRPSLELIRYLFGARRNRKYSGKIIVVMSPCHILVPIFRMILNCQIVLDAGWPLLDGAISRNTFDTANKKINIVKFWFTDFVCFKLAHFIAFESDAQKKKSIKQFRLNENKVFTSYSGFAENQFQSKSNPDDCLLLNFCPKCKSSNYKIILFRGKYNSEAGIDIIDRAARETIQSDVKFVFAVSSIPSNFTFESKSIVIRDFITSNQMRHLYENASLAIGQVSENIRLNFTIPHKAFEAGYFGTPYLTRDAIGIREIFPLDSQAVFYNPSMNNLNTLISSVINDQEFLKSVSKAAHKRYYEIASQSVITESFLRNINSVQKS